MAEEIGLGVNEPTAADVTFVAVGSASDNLEPADCFITGDFAPEEMKSPADDLTHARGKSIRAGETTARLIRTNLGLR